MMERYRVFMKRFELSEDFQAKLTVEQLRTQLGQFGLTPEKMFEQMELTLERMKSQQDRAKKDPAPPHHVPTLLRIPARRGPDYATAAGTGATVTVSGLAGGQP